MRAGGARPGDHRKLRDAAFVVPAFALLLLLPPFLNLFAIGGLLFGIPIEVAYIFAIWAALVVAAALLSRCLPRHAGVEPPPDPAASGPPASGPAASGRADHI